MSSPRAVSIVKNPQFVRLWAIGGFTSTMMWLDMLVIALLTLDLTDSPFLVSLTFFLRFTPMLFGVGISLIADRMNRKYLMLFGLSVQVAVSAALAALVITDTIEFWHLGLGAFITGTVMASEFPVRRTMIGEVVDPDRVGRAVALESGTSAGSRILGPILGGAFLATIGAEGGFLLGIVFYGTAFVVALSMKYQPPEREVDRAGPFQQVREGVSYISGSQLMVGTLVVTLLMNVFGFPYVSQQPVVAREDLMVNDVLVGALQSIEGLGSFIGAALIVAFARPQHYARIYLYGSLLFLVAIVVFSRSDWYWVSFVTVFIGGFGMASFAAMQSAIMIYAASPAMRARVMGSVAMFIGLGPMGQLIIGQLAEWLDPQTAILIIGGIGLVTVAASSIAFPILRNGRATEVDREQRRAQARELEQTPELDSPSDSA
ncbi:MAG: MFS transporter [Chloroflexi bacterium]|nr:MFS transporter [Chloroflexota bacterium]MBT4514704.1 MFS transporter [Chloroflexota bacterium]MBT5318987.1 MFS transporter [Chloroflexota bacterium]